MDHMFHSLHIFHVFVHCSKDFLHKTITQSTITFYDLVFVGITAV